MAKNYACAKYVQRTEKELKLKIELSKDIDTPNIGYKVFDSVQAAKLEIKEDK